MTPFPQANNMELVYNLFFDISPDGISKDFVAKKYGYTERQGSYYLDALCFLGLTQKINSKYFLTTKGAELRLAAQDDVKKCFCNVVLENEFFNEAYDVFKRYKYLTKPELAELISKKIYDNYDLSESTTMRRANTVIHWLWWLDNNLKEETI